MDKILAGIVKVAVFLAWILGVPVLRGYVMVRLWAWFMIPMFKLPPLPVAGAIGLMVVVGMVTTKYEPKKKDKTEDFTYSKAITNMLITTLIPLVFLFEGWIIQKYMP